MSVGTAGAAHTSPGFCGNHLPLADILPFFNAIGSRMKIDDGFIIGTVVDGDRRQSFGSGGTIGQKYIDRSGKIGYPDSNSNETGIRPAMWIKSH